MEFTSPSPKSFLTGSNAVPDERNNISSKQFAEYLNSEIRHVVLPTVVFVGFEMVLGFVGNLLVIYVFIFHYRVCNYKYFVITLAVIDFFTTVTTMPGEIITQIYWYVYSAPSVCKIKSFCNVFTLTAEAMCLLAIAVERYRKVCCPFAWQIKTQQTKLICLSIPFVSALIALPDPFLWGERTLLKTYKNMTAEVTICEKEEKFATTQYPLIHISIVSFLISAMFVLMICSYSYVLAKIMQEKRNTLTNVGFHEEPVCNKTNDTNDVETEDTSLSSSPEKQQIPKALTRWRLNSTRIAGGKRLRSKTKVMLSVTLTFMVTTIVYLVLVSIISSSYDILQKLSDVNKAVYFFFLRLYFINHVINPFIYGVLDPRFKKALQLLFHRDTSHA